MSFLTLPDRSYGIIPIAKMPSGYQLLLIKQIEEHWSFPKGHAYWREVPIETARRELLEETGISDAYIIQDISFESNYIYSGGWITRKRKVIFFPGFVEKQGIKMQESEIVDYAWVNYQEARELMTYPDMMKMVDKVDNYLISTNVVSLNNEK